MKKVKKTKRESILIFVAIFIIFSISTIPSEEFGYNFLDPGENLNLPQFDNNTAMVNTSVTADFWDLLDTPLDITFTDMWNRSGTNVFTAHPGDDVGIGTDSPGADVEISRAGAAELRLTDSDSSQYTAIRQGSGGGGFFEISRLGTGGVDIAVQADGDIILAELTGGNVGIGTNSPDALLHLLKATGASVVKIETDAGGADYAVLHLKSGGSDYHIKHSATNDAVEFVNLDTANTDMVIDGGGNVGIGTTLPTEVLQVAGNILLQNDSDKLYFGQGKDVSINYNGSDTLFTNEVGSGNFIFSTGNIGIRQAVPLHELQVNGGIGIEAGGQKTGVNGIHIFYSGTKGTITATDPGVANRDLVLQGLTMDLQANGGSALFIDNVGQVGIGTSIPTHKINVVGNANITGNITTNQYYGEMWMHNDTSSKTMVIASANVWINISFNSTDAESGQTLNGFTFNEVTNALTTQVAGLYKVDYSISTGNVGNNQEYEFTIAINDILQNNTDAHRKIGASGDVGNAGSGGFITLTVGDRVNLQSVNRDGTANLLVHSVNVNLVRIGN